MDHLLIIDDEDSICYAFRRHFEGRGMRVTVAPTAQRGLEVCRHDAPDVAVLDVCLPDADGLTLLDELRVLTPATRILVITAFGTLDTATRAVAGKAFDYLVKPLDLDQVSQAVTRALSSRDAGPGPAGGKAATGQAMLVGSSAAMQQVYRQMAWATHTDAAVLITGDTGTGKELAARAIHERGARRQQPFVAVNCGALPEPLVESELFGYTRGAFSGAVADKPGRIETADGGTLFLDEIGDLPLAAQVKLLRFLDAQTVDRLGSLTPRRLDVRVVTATNRDLSAAIARHSFRADLYYRLAVIEIRMPRLAERPEDILPTARELLAQMSPALPPKLLPDAEALLLAWSWPGNVRELRNALQHALAICGGGPIHAAHLPRAVQANPTAAAAATLVSSSPETAMQALAAAAQWGTPGVYARALERVERALITRALAEADGCQVAASEHLGMHRNTLRRKIQELGIQTASEAPGEVP
jgi:two-component system nitrogen regulation response regulator GlnG